MKLNFKLFLLFSFVGLIPYLISTGIGLITARQATLANIYNQLESIAAIQEQRIEETLANYLDDVSLVSSRVLLRDLVARYNERPNSILAGEIVEILDSELDGSPDILQAKVYSLTGELIASSGRTVTPELPSDSKIFEQGRESIRLVEVYKDQNNIILVRLVGPLIEDNELVGILEINADYKPILDITSDHRGLSKTGEVLLAKDNGAGDALFLTPLRFDPGAALKRAAPKEQINMPTIQAVSGHEKFLDTVTTLDYRNVPVFAVTKYIEALDWAVVTKIDRAEALEPVNQLIRSFMVTLLIAIIVIIVIASAIAKNITSPIESLSKFALSLSKNNFSARTKVAGGTEIGFLAETMNKMADQLEVLYRDLEKKVVSRTHDLAKSKARSDAIISSIGDGLVFTDLNNRIIFANDVAYKLLDYKSGTLQKKNWVQLVKPCKLNGDKVPVKHLPINRIKKLDPKSEIEPIFKDLTYLTGQGRRLPVKVTTSLVVSKGKAIGIIIVFRDITLEYEIDKAKTEFVSLASHQLRTPLTGIKWFSETLLSEEMGKLNSAQMESLQGIYDSNNNMIELVNSLLNVSRIELGTFEIKPEEVRVKILLDSILSEFNKTIKDKKLKVVTKVSPVNKKMNADPRILRMVLQNVISNSIKYTESKGEIEIGISYKSEAGWVIEVTDNGLGIPEQQQKSIFDKLFRADNVKLADTEGTGLGLYIVKSVVDKAGGKIHFESKEGSGTKFRIVFPESGMKVKRGNKSLG